MIRTITWYYLDQIELAGYEWRNSIQGVFQGN
jgi:hypothetical protein